MTWCSVVYRASGGGDMQALTLFSLAIETALASPVTAQFVEAFRYVESGEKVGNVVLEMAPGARP